MTKVEAIEAMLKGEKVIHDYFVDGEWITIENGKIVNEDGYSFDYLEYWKYRQKEWWDKDWEIFKEKIL